MEDRSRTSKKQMGRYQIRWVIKPPGSHKILWGEGDSKESTGQKTKWEVGNLVFTGTETLEGPRSRP